MGELKSLVKSRETKYREASECIKSAEYAIEKVKESGCDISSASSLLEEANSVFNAGNYEEAIEYAKQAEGEALRLKKDYEDHKEASTIISSIKSKIAELKLSGVKTPEAEELLKHAKSELNENNFEQAKELAEEAKNVANERRTEYGSAVESISEAEEIFSKIRADGAVIPNELLTKSKQTFDDGDYEIANGLAEELKNLVNTIETKYRESKERIKSAKSAIEWAEESGCDISSAFGMLEEANSTFDAGNYKEAIECAKQSEDIAKTIQEESKPEITLNRPEETFPPNQWKRIDVTIRNTGSMHAKDISIEPSGDIEFRRIPTISQLNTNETETITIAMKPTVVGDVPIDIVLTYKDALDRDYTSSEEVWVTVAESTPERPPPAKQAASIEIERGYEVLSNNDLRFGIRVTNSTDYAIMDVKTILDYPRTLFSLKGSEIQILTHVLQYRPQIHRFPSINNFP